MTYFVTALSNDKAQLIEHELRTSDLAAADLVADMWEQNGFRIVRREEG